MEYWALVWGTIVMAVTGVMIWAKVEFGNHLPRWVIDAATAVHFYEAILASLAILVWHFYMIIFDPEVYPMNWAWYDGKVTYELYQSEHGLDVETLNQAVEADAREQASRKFARSGSAWNGTCVGRRKARIGGKGPGRPVIGDPQLCRPDRAAGSLRKTPARVRSALELAFEGVIPSMASDPP